MPPGSWCLRIRWCHPCLERSPSPPRTSHIWDSWCRVSEGVPTRKANRASVGTAKAALSPESKTSAKKFRKQLSLCNSLRCHVLLFVSLPILPLRTIFARIGACWPYTWLTARWTLRTKQGKDLLQAVRTPCYINVPFLSISHSRIHAWIPADLLSRYRCLKPLLSEHRAFASSWSLQDLQAPLHWDGRFFPTLAANFQAAASVLSPVQPCANSLEVYWSLRLSKCCAWFVWTRSFAIDYNLLTSLYIVPVDLVPLQRSCFNLIFGVSPSKLSARKKSLQWLKVEI